MSSRGYKLVCCNLSGVNAFFVKDEDFYTNFSDIDILEHYQPARFYLTKLESGYKPSLKFLKNRLE